MDAFIERLLFNLKKKSASLEATVAGTQHVYLAMADIIEETAVEELRDRASQCAICGSPPGAHDSTAPQVSPPFQMPVAGKGGSKHQWCGPIRGGRAGAGAGPRRALRFLRMVDMMGVHRRQGEVWDPPCWPDRVGDVFVVEMGHGSVIELRVGQDVEEV